MVNKAVLMRKVSKASGISFREASDCINVVFEAMVDALSRGERIELRGFGSFTAKQVSRKKYPSSFSTQKIIQPHGKVVFRPCQKLRESVWNQKANSIALRVEQPAEVSKFMPEVQGTGLESESKGCCSASGATG